MSDREMQDCWSNAEIYTATEAGVETTVPGKVHSGVPGLAVTSCQFGLFEVTHVPTGLRITEQLERFANAACRLLEAGLIAKTYGFTWAEKSVLKAIEPHYEKPMPFDGYYSIKAGEKIPHTVTAWIQAQSDSVDCHEFPWEGFYGPWGKMGSLHKQLLGLDSND